MNEDLIRQIEQNQTRIATIQADIDYLREQAALTPHFDDMLTDVRGLRSVREQALLIALRERLIK